MEYGFYVGNYGGKLVPVPSKPPAFALDLDAIEAAITDKTRVILIDSPNNPTGVVYNRDELERSRGHADPRRRGTGPAYLPGFR